MQAVMVGVGARPMQATPETGLLAVLAVLLGAVLGWLKWGSAVLDRRDGKVWKRLEDQAASQDRRITSLEERNASQAARIDLLETQVEQLQETLRTREMELAGARMEAGRLIAINAEQASRILELESIVAGLRADLADREEQLRLLRG